MSVHVVDVPLVESGLPSARVRSHSTRRRIAHWFVAGLDGPHLFLFAALLSIGWPIWSILLSPPPMRYTALPLPLETPYVEIDHHILSRLDVARAGLLQGAVPVIGPLETLPISISGCNRTGRTLIYVVTRSLRNVETDEITLLPQQTTEAPPGCTTVLLRLHILPLDVAPGSYRLFGSALIATRFRTYQIAYETSTFRLLPPGEVPTPSVPGGAAEGH